MLTSFVEPALVDVPSYRARSQDVEVVQTAADCPNSHRVLVLQAAGVMSLTYGAATIRWHHGHVQRLELRDV